MKSWIERYTAPLILIVVFVSFIAFAYRIWNQVGLKPGAESLTLLNDIIVLGTALVLIWYTYETYKLRETAQKQIEVAQGQLAESQRQTELQLRPFVILEVSISEHDEFSYRVRNIGVGTAINVHIMDIQPDGADWSFRFLPYFFPVIEPRETRKVQPRLWSQDRLEEIVEWQRYRDLEEGRDFSVRIEFSNVDTARYYVSQYYRPHTEMSYRFHTMIIRSSGPHT